MKKLFASLILVFGGWIVTLATPSIAAAKSYSIDKVDINATIMSSGAMSVEEARTYDFDGDFTFAYQNIKKQPDATKDAGRAVPYKLSNFRMCDETSCYKLTDDGAESQTPSERVNSFYVKDEADQYYVKWFYDASNVKKTFTLKYTVDNAITIQRDIAELYWQWVGDEWDHAQYNVNISLLLPNGIANSDIQAWAHGPTSGRVSIPSAEKVVFQLNKLPIETFFEGRVLLPAAIFTTGAGAPGGSTKALITKQENRYIQDTIAKVAQERQIAIFFGGANVAFMAAMIIFFVKSFIEFWKHHKERPLPKVSISGTLWDPPSELSPAQVEQLLSARKTLTPKSFTATILNLVHRRYFKFVRSDKKEGFLFPDWKYFLLNSMNSQLGDSLVWN